MCINSGHVQTMKKSTSMILGVLLVTLTLVSASEGSYDGPMDTAATLDDAEVTRNFQKMLWDLYLLPRLENSLGKDTEEAPSETKETPDEPGLAGLPLFQSSQLPRFIQRTRIKRGRGIAGLDNMDILLKTMDLNRNRGRPMLSVSGMNTDRLRNLMSLQGRRRK